MRTWKDFASILSALAITVGAGSPIQAEPLRIFYFDWAGYGPFFVAREKGFYVREGIEVELVPVADSHAAYASLFSGHVDAVAAVVQDIPFFATPDDKLECVLALAEPIGDDGIVAHEDIESVADLQGRTVAYEEGSSTHFFLNFALLRAGLRQADVDAVEVPDSDAVTAFLLGEVDALSTYGGMLIEASQAAHAHVLIDSSEQPGIIVACLITTPERLERREADLEALRRAWDAAIDYVDEHLDEAVEIMASAIGGAHRDPEVFSQTLQKIQFYDEERNIAYFGTPDDPGPVYETAQTAIDVWRSTGVLDFEMKPADMIAHDLWDD